MELEKGDIVECRPKEIDNYWTDPRDKWVSNGWPEEGDLGIVLSADRAYATVRWLSGRIRGAQTLRLIDVVKVGHAGGGG